MSSICTASVLSFPGFTPISTQAMGGAPPAYMSGMNRPQIPSQDGSQHVSVVCKLGNAERQHVS